MKKTIILSAALIIATVLAACNNSSSPKPATTDTTAMKPAMDTTKSGMMATTKYTCTMHPEVVSDTPGKCPKCGMAMVAIKAGAAKDSMPMKHDSTMKMN
jgi:hypothetical protein